MKKQPWMRAACVAAVVLLAVALPFFAVRVTAGGGVFGETTLSTVPVPFWAWGIVLGLVAWRLSGGALAPSALGAGVGAVVLVVLRAVRPLTRGLTGEWTPAAGSLAPGLPAAGPASAVLLGFAGTLFALAVIGGLRQGFRWERQLWWAVPGWVAAAVLAGVADGLLAAGQQLGESSLLALRLGGVALALAVGLSAGLTVPQRTSAPRWAGVALLCAGLWLIARTALLLAGTVSPALVPLLPPTLEDNALTGLLMGLCARGAFAALRRRAPAAAPAVREC